MRCIRVAIGLGILTIGFANANSNAAIAAPGYVCDVSAGQAETPATSYVFPVGNPFVPPSKDTFDPNGYIITQGYKSDRRFHDKDHLGVDLATRGNATGGEVRAIGDGRVVYRQDILRSDTMGHMIRIEHMLPDETFVYSQYAHLEAGSMRVYCGDPVLAGTPIGDVGKTGTEKGHLHFEIKRVNRKDCGYFPSSICSQPTDLSEYESPIAFIENGGDGGDVFYLRFLEGNPGIAGDGITISSVGGRGDRSFELDSFVSLEGVSDGVTVSAFLPDEIPISTSSLSLQTSFRFAGKEVFECSVGTSGPEILTPEVNDKVGIATIHSQAELERLLGLVTDESECEDLTISDMRIYRFFIHHHQDEGVFLIKELDALAVGIGENVFPRANTPPP